MRIGYLEPTAAALALSLLGLAACGDDGGSTADGGDPVDGGETDSGDPQEDGGGDSGEEQPCDTTWAAIQKTILQGRGCTTDACHDSDEPGGMLDLTREAAYESIINVESRADIEMSLVTPGDEDLSLLYLKLEAKTEDVELPAGAGSPMPAAGNAIAEDELAALRLWIRAGAPEDTVVDGTQDLLECELPDDADPNKVVPPPVPESDKGFQHYSGPWTVEPNSENEVCFGTYYDLTDVAPDWAKVDCTIGEIEQTCVAFQRRQLTQDAQSHHSIIAVYAGEGSPTDPDWGSWRCGGGESAGEECDPSQPDVPVADGGGDCGERAICQTEVRDQITCNGFGPSDADIANVGAGGAQTPVSTDDYPEGVYGVVPIKGVVTWNSHAFNLTKKPTTIEQYNNFWYAPPEDQKHRIRPIFDTTHIFVMSVPPFESEEYCATYTLPQYARLTNLNSHSHKRGVRWRTWLPPNESCAPPDCEPKDEDPVYLSRVYNDPVYLDFDPPLEFDDEDPASRTLKYCSKYDNGEADPSTVKRASGVPEGATSCEPTHCVGGPDEGAECSSDDDCGGEGACDACTLLGGFTTEDEMMILQGDFFVQPPEE